MNLQRSIEAYVEDKRSAGLSYTKGNQSLMSFQSQVGDVSLDKIRSEDIEAFLSGPRTSDLTWSRKYNLLRGFFQFWAARDLVRSLAMPSPRRPAKRSTAPYIYSQAEIRLLLKATLASQANANCMIDARTLRTFLLFLYGTGVMVGEGVRLLRKDVDFKRGLLSLRNSRKEPSRVIPIGPDMQRILQSYSRSHHPKSPANEYFFVHKGGRSPREAYLNNTFQRLRKLAGIERHDGVSYPPRMHDLRYTFAVHRLTAWHRHGANLNRMIPALSVYMGYINLSASARFLSLTPERFRSQLNKLSPRQRKRHWRDDPKLMNFLAKL